MEFKTNIVDPRTIGEYVSAPANVTMLADKDPHQGRWNARYAPFLAGVGAAPQA